MRVLITGASGFLGYHITRACLDAGHEVLCLRRSSSRNPFSSQDAARIRWFELEDTWAVEQFAPQVLVHAAWTGLNHDDRNNTEVQRRNITLQEELLKLYAYEQVIILGSMEEYGYPGVLMTEELPLKPFSAYTYAKVACLEALQTYVSQRAIQWQWIRVCTIYGVKQQSAWLIPTLIDNCLRGEEYIETSKGEQEYSFLFAEDFGRGIASVIGQKDKSGIYNISSHAPIHLYTLFDLVKELTNYQGVFTKTLPYRGNGNLMVLADSSKFRQNFGEFETVSLRTGLMFLIQNRE